MSQGPSTLASTTPGIARTFLRLRVAMSLVVTLLVAWHLYETHAHRQATHDAADSERVARLTASLIVSGGRERGLAALSACLPSDAERAATIKGLREQLDLSYLELVRDARRLGETINNPAIERVLERVERERRSSLEARQLLERPPAERPCEVAADRWIAAVSALHEALLALHAELLDSAVSRAPSFSELAHLRLLMVDVVECAGRERALLGVDLAVAERHGANERRELHEHRGVVLHSLARLDGFLEGRATAGELGSAAARIRQIFFGDFEATRAQAYACLSDAAPCSLTTTRWFELATVGIDSIVDASKLAAEQAAREFSAQTRNANLRSVLALLVSALAVTLIGFASRFTTRRIIGRLQQVRDAALLVARGELERPVALTGRDELGDMAGAVEQMRTTLGKQNHELRELVDELKQAQQQLVQQERLASVGQLAGGVAHEVNSPLAVILANVSHLIDALEGTAAHQRLDREELLEVLREVRTATERTANIVRDLRDFAAIGPALKHNITNLDDDVQLAVRALQPALPAQVRLRLELDAPVPVAGSRSAIEQILQRLVDNASKACGTGGTVTVRTATVKTPAGERAQLTVADDGRGISAEHLPRVTEPFFTTRGVGAGTGLGLSVCVGIVRQLGGELAIDSAPGQGTVVTITLPVPATVPATSG